MEISGSYTFNAPPDRVWDLLMDPAVISSCIPGCDRFEPDGEDRYNVTLTVGLAAITGTYNGTVVLTDKIPHTSYRLVVEGQGRPGFVKGSSAIALRAEGATTAVDVTGTVQTGGPIARVGQRLIGGVAKMMLDRFFACLQAKLEVVMTRARLALAIVGLVVAGSPLARPLSGRRPPTATSARSSPGSSSCSSASTGPASRLPSSKGIASSMRTASA